jgi:hypothetical protein
MRALMRKSTRAAVIVPKRSDAAGWCQREGFKLTGRGFQNRVCFGQVRCHSEYSEVGKRPDRVC